MTGYYLQPRYRLGKWKCSHQHWTWRGNNYVAVHKDGRQYRRDGRKLLAVAERMIDEQTLTPIDVREGRDGYLTVRDAGRTQTTTAGLNTYKRLNGLQYPTVSQPKFTDVEGDIVIATDGTVKQGKGGAAYVVTSSYVPGTTKGVLPVDGAPWHTTSYRTELYGMLGALLTLQTLLQQQRQQWVRLSGTLWCDNKAAVKRFNDLEDDKPFSLTIANQTDADVLQELRVLKYNLPIEVSAAWVKGHQTSPKTKEARLNIIADRIADEQHDTSGEWATRQRSEMLPHTNAQLVIDGKRYTGSINKRIQYRMYEAKARQYISEKLGLHRTCGLIDWEPVGALHRRLSWKRRATRAKFIFRWAPTNSRQHLIGQSDTPQCPLCEQEHESTEHVFRCEEPTAVAVRKAALEDLEDTLVEASTHPDLVTLIVLALTEEVEAEQDSLLQHGEENLATLMRQQEDIGWGLVKYGFLGKAWARTQESWMRHTTSSMNTLRLGRWKKTVQDTLWQYVVTVWEHRNGVVHGHTVAQQQFKKLEALRQECVIIISNEPVVAPDDQHLLGVDLSEKNGLYLHHWKRAVKAAVRREKMRSEKQTRSDIAEYFQRIRRRIRAQGNTGRQRSIRDFLVADAQEPSTHDRQYENTSDSLRRIRILAQREIASNSTRRQDDAEE